MTRTPIDTAGRRRGGGAGRGLLAALALGLAAAACAAEAPVADVLAATFSGPPGRYRATVTVRSPDTGCERYADWWEVLTPEGELVYRRILLHSHAGEQPFTRAGGPVAVAPDAELVIRAHMHPTGYGGRVLRGTPASGFAPWDDAPPDLAPALAGQGPQPSGCRF